MSSPRRPSPPTPGDVFGVPLLPPGEITAGTNRTRAALRRLHRGVAPPPIQILEGLFGLLDHRVLVLLCELGVPDVLTRPMSARALAERVGADPVRLERVLRFASTRGWVRIDRRGRVRPTRVTAFLRADHPGGWRDWVGFLGSEEVVAALHALSVTPGTNDDFAIANGETFFEYAKDHPEFGAVFDRAMGAGGRVHALAINAALDWSSSEHVCDVGGGTGDLLVTLLDLQPHLSGTVFDLPDVIARALRHPRLTAVEGDAFTSIPCGFDTYLLVNVLHDWSDDDARRLLERIATATEGRPARIVVVDGGRPVVPRDDVAVCTDLLMAALTNGGRERDTAGFAALASAAGLELTGTTRLASGDFAHELHTTN